MIAIVGAAGALDSEQLRVNRGYLLSNLWDKNSCDLTPQSRIRKDTLLIKWTVAVNRLSMTRIMTRRTKAARVVA